MTHRIALNFEDGVTRFIDCRDGEKVLDAAFRQRINLPMDCADGVCGTCKCRAESGNYTLGEDYLDDALSRDEATAGLVLTCQMVPSSDCVIAVPARSAQCKTGQASFQAIVTDIQQHGDAVSVLTLEVTGAVPVFLPGQYVNIEVPGSGLHRAYSFSSAPGQSRLQFLIKRLPGGLMSHWLERAQAGATLSLSGPLGCFYLRDTPRPLLLLAGGTGLAPLLSMLRVLATREQMPPTRLVYGVNRDADLVMLPELDALAADLVNFSYTTVVADADSTHPRKGWVTQHLPDDALNGGDVDIYLCGPPPMVDAVRRHLDQAGLIPVGFYYEKFNPGVSARDCAA